MINDNNYFREINQILSLQYKDFDHFNRKNPLEELLFIVCSAKTDEAKYLASFRSLKKAYPKFRDLADASVEEIALAIKAGGLSNQKASAIKEILNAIIREFGTPTLAPLKAYSNADCESFLLSLSRVGKKTARCVMMYSLGRQVFPVDTHCWRISQRIGWIKSTYSDGRCSQKDMDRLQNVIPTHFRFRLHVNMISLGRSICRPLNPNCNSCPISEYCLRLID